MNAEDKLAAALWEADRHLQTLQEALKEWEADPRQQESNNLLKRLDTRFHGYDDTRFISEGSDNNTHTAPAKA
ncbi:MAG: hypothetical protein LM522_02685 [Candidatus Contendobacter sp.]|nr:hypothetical protein [Candidatus Contendobacter sp.]